MNSKFHTLLKCFCCLMVVVAIHHLPLVAQSEDGSTTKLIIIKEYIDADGNKKVERIEKEGPEAEQFDMENFSNGGPNIQWRSFDFDSEDSPFRNFNFDRDGSPFGSFDFDGQMPDLQEFFGGFFGDEGGMRGFMTPFGSTAEKPKLGIQIQELESQEGVVIMSVQPGSVAEEVGLEIGDVILAVDGEAIESPNQLADIIRSHEFGDKISLDLLRDDRHLIMEAQLGTARQKEIKTRKI